MKYCNISRPNTLGVGGVLCDKEIFNPYADDFKTVGDVVRSSLDYGASMDLSAQVSFDVDDDGDGVDMMASPNLDFFDIADEIGAQAAVANVTASTSLKSDDSSTGVE